MLDRWNHLFKDKNKIVKYHLILNLLKIVLFGKSVRYLCLTTTQRIVLNDMIGAANESLEAFTRRPHPSEMIFLPVTT